MIYATNRIRQPACHSSIVLGVDSAGSTTTTSCCTGGTKIGGSSTEFESLFTRVDEALAKGDLWRARTILQGALGHRVYVPELYEKLGQVKLQFGDLPGAGKYLFLSGETQPEYEAAIKAYLDRHRLSFAARLYESFPRAARLTAVDDYRASIRPTLRKYGLQGWLAKQPKKRTGPNSIAGNDLWGLVIGGVILALIACTLLGVATAVSWVF